MNTIILNPEVRQILVEAGWSETRKFPIQEWVDSLRGRGICLSSASENVLQQLGGLTICPPERQDNISAQAEVIKFNPFGISKRSLAFWEDKVRLHLSPLGEIDEQADFCMADNGICYVGFGMLWEIGIDINEALAALCLGNRKWTEIWRPKGPEKGRS